MSKTKDNLVTRFKLMAAVRAAGVSSTALAVASCISARWQDKHEFARVGAKEIAEEITRSHKTVLRGINELVERGLLKKQKTVRASLYFPGSKIGDISPELIDWTPVSTLTAKKPNLNPEWRNAFPGLEDMTDDDFEALCKDTTRAAQLSNQTGWTMEECLSAGPFWVNAQLSTMSLSQPDRTDGINKSRFLDYCPEHRSTESRGERYVKQWELTHGLMQ